MHYDGFFRAFWMYSDPEWFGSSFGPLHHPSCGLYTAPVCRNVALVGICAGGCLRVDAGDSTNTDREIMRIKWVALESLGNSVSSESLSIYAVSIALISTDLQNIFSLVKHIF